MNTDNITSMQCSRYLDKLNMYDHMIYKKNPKTF